MEVKEKYIGYRVPLKGKLLSLGKSTTITKKVLVKGCATCQPEYEVQEIKVPKPTARQRKELIKLYPAYYEKKQTLENNE